VWDGPGHGPARRSGCLSPTPSPLPPTHGTSVGSVPSDAPPASASAKPAPPWPRPGVEEEKRTGDMLTTASHHLVAPLLFSCTPQRVNASREAGAGTLPVPSTRPHKAPTSPEQREDMEAASTASGTIPKPGFVRKGRRNIRPVENISPPPHQLRWPIKGPAGEPPPSPPPLRAPH
jgi:hypothetical protein